MSDYCWDGTHEDEPLLKSECVTCLQARTSELKAENQRLKAVAEAAEKYINKGKTWVQRPLIEALRAAGYLGGGENG